MLVALLCLGVFGRTSAAEDPKITGLDVELRDGSYLAAFVLEDAFDQYLLDTIASGLPVTFRYRIQIYRRRPLWPDAMLLTRWVNLTVDFDSLTSQYHLTREIDDQVVGSSVAEKAEEMRRWMTVVEDLELGPLLDDTQADLFVRVKCRLFSRFAFFFFPRAVETRWARTVLPVPPDHESP